MCYNINFHADLLWWSFSAGKQAALEQLVPLLREILPLSWIAKQLKLMLATYASLQKLFQLHFLASLYSTVS